MYIDCCNLREVGLNARSKGVQNERNISLSTITPNPENYKLEIQINSQKKFKFEKGVTLFVYLH